MKRKEKTPEELEAMLEYAIKHDKGLVAIDPKGLEKNIPLAWKKLIKSDNRVIIHNPLQSL